VTAGDIFLTHPLLLQFKRPGDWPDWVRPTGYWFLDDPNIGWTPPPGFVDFFKAGDKPVYIGFGSIVVDDPDALTNIIIEAVKKAKVRAIVAKGWSARLQDGDKDKHKSKEKAPAWPASIFPVSQVPHDWLFPQLAGVVHHGGAGTTAAGLRAGCPTVIKPFFGDQYFWASRITELGVGVSTRSLTIDTLAECLVAITTNAEMQKKARELGVKLRQEDGVTNAIDGLYRELHRLEVRSAESGHHGKKQRGTCASFPFPVTRLLTFSFLLLHHQEVEWDYTELEGDESGFVHIEEN